MVYVGVLAFFVLLKEKESSKGKMTTRREWVIPKLGQ